MGKAQPLVWSGGEGSGRPTWFWGNQREGAEPACSIQAMPRGSACTQAIVSLYLSFCKAIVLKQRAWEVRKDIESLWLQRWRKRPASLGWRRESWCFPQTGNGWWLDGDAQSKKKQGTLLWHHLQPHCCAQPGRLLEPTTKNTSFLSLI